jgi:putative nucleotidyltransferase with HDIG domain
VWRNRKLRGRIYQSRIAPESDALTTKRKTRVTDTDSWSTGTNGKEKLYPFWGTFQENLDTISDIRAGTRSTVTRVSDRVMMGYLAILATTAISLAAIVLVEQGIDHGLPLFALAVVAALSERANIRLSATTQTSIALLPVIFAAVVFGPVGGMTVGAASLLADFNPPYMKWGVYTSTRAITGVAAGVAAEAGSALASRETTAIVLATVIAAVVAESLDAAFAATTHRLRGNGRAGNLLRVAGPLVVAALPMYVPVVAVLAVAYEEVSAWTLPLFFVPAVAAQRLFMLYREQSALSDELRETNDLLERANLSFASALVATLDARDRYTAGHSAAVAVYARDIAARMGLSADDQDVAHLCGLVHDIGKIGLPPGLLEKPGPLTLEERRLMEEHAVIGETILANVEGYSEIAHIVRHHHERVDGNGYPDRLVSEDIPVVSKILAVADAYDAMTSDRPYRDAMPSRVARLRLAQAVETQFDTTVVAAFEAILAGANDEYRGGVVGARFAPATPFAVAAV